LVWLGGYNATIATFRFVGVVPVLMYAGGTPKVFFTYQLLVAVSELAGLLIAVGTAMAWARPTVQRNPPEKWVNNPVEFDQAVRAANLIFEALRPPGDPSPRREHSNWHGPIASEMLLTITRGDSKAHFFGMESELIRSLLGPEIVKRIKVEEPKS
jgi:hypothetical protein